MFKNTLFKSIIFLLTVMLAFLPFMQLNAVEVKGLYQASIAITSQKSTDRSLALKKALAAVMLKVGGEQSVLNNKIIKKSLSNYGQYLTQYRYHYKTRQVTDQQKHKKQLFLLASFDEKKINQLFQAANLPLWGSLRPQVLLWLVEEQGLTRRIMSNTSSSNLPLMVNEFSTQRGLPIMMPLMDLIDTNQIKLSDVWGRFQEPIKDGSSRYLAEAIAVMRISNTSLVTRDNNKENNKENMTASDCDLPCAKDQPKEQSYVLDWRLLDWNIAKGQQQFSQKYQGNSPQKLLQQGLSDITELIYQRYALSTTSQNDFVIEVANIDSLSTYVDVFDFLNDLSSVKSVTLLSAKGSARRFNLQLLGSTDAFLASLKLNKQLKQFVDPLSKNIIKNIIPVFYWGS